MTADGRRPGRSWVLVTEGGAGESRAAVAATRALTAAGHHVAVTVTDRLSLAGASRHCRRRVQVPPVATDPEGYAAAVRQETTRHAYLTVLPVSDAALVALGGPGADLVHKEQVVERAAVAGLRTPPTLLAATVEDAADAARRLSFPVVVKPDVKRTRARRVDSLDRLAALPAAAFPALVQPYLPDPLRGVVGLMWHGRLVSAAHLRYLRVYPHPCGTVAAAVTVAPDVALERGLERLLAGYDGVFHVDLAGDHLLDVNPRVHASLPVAVAAGADVLQAYCALLEGGTPLTRRARPGVRFRWLEGDLRSVAASVRRGETTLGGAVGALAPRPGTVHSFSSVRDPGPSAARAAFAVRHLRAKRVARQGRDGRSR